MLRQCFPPPVTEWLRGLWAERETFLSVLDRLPQTICHHDAFRRNLFAQRRADGEEQTVAIDWAFAGIGALGAELTPLVQGSLGFFEVRDCAPRELTEATLTAYVTGMREAGWGGDERLVRLGFLATAALLYTVGTTGLTMAMVADPTEYPTFERAMGLSMAEAVAAWAELSTFKFEQVEEARRLLTQLTF
jgi:Phosphotransferase enzyme family